MPLIKVLLVEDELLMRQFATQVLAYKGVEVSSATDTEEADKILQREKVDVIVCDVLMPGENGPSFVQRLRAKGSRTPVIFLSGLGDHELSKLSKQAGATDYLTKPFDTEHLYQLILQYFRSEG